MNMGSRQVHIQALHTSTEVRSSILCRAVCLREVVC